MISTDFVPPILVISVDNPPVNALSHSVRAGILAALDEADANPTVEAVIIRCRGRVCFAGADISEFGKPAQSPSLPELIDRIEASNKPVIAAINGTALGGGLEVAMACHYRLALSTARLGLPEVTLGLLPGAGGTQRLPRLIGLEAAIPLIAEGRDLPAGEAHRLGLIDQLTSEEDLDREAFEDARTLIGRPIRRSGEQEVVGEVGMVDAWATANARALKGRDSTAPILAALRAACALPLAEGLAVERAGFLSLIGGSQSAALRHAFFAERAAQRIDGLARDIAQRQINRVGIIGAGTMGAGIAMNFLSAGIPVVLIEREQAALDRGAAHIRDTYARALQRGRMTQQSHDAALAALVPALDYAALAECDLVIEAVFELMDIKREVFAKIAAATRPNTILATNTSYLDINEIARSVPDPSRVLGLHFFSPANLMKLLEVVRAEQTAPQVLASAMALAKQIGKTAVVSGVCDGFIGNRMLKVRQGRAMALIAAGAPFETVDRVLTDFGFPMGPFQMTDLAGLDIGWDARTSAGRTIRERLCEAGLRGQKNGRGFYDYDVARNRTPSDTAAEIIRGFAADHGIAQRSFTEAEILDLLLLPMVNEGWKIVGEGIAQRASDVDVVWLNGYGWPRTSGGPLHWGAARGAAQLVADLRRLAPDLGTDFEIAPLLLEQAGAGAGSAQDRT